MTRRIIDNRLQCSKCKLWYPVDLFPKRKRGGRVSQCPNCTNPDRKYKALSGFVYFIGYDDFIKIGYSTSDVDTLYLATQSKNPEKLTLYGIIRSDDIQTLEAALHQYFRDVWYRGEWFTNINYILPYVSSLDNYEELMYSRDIHHPNTNRGIGIHIEVTTKVCASCGIEKSYSEFHKQCSSPDGYRYKCKECRK